MLTRVELKNNSGWIAIKKSMKNKNGKDIIIFAVWSKYKSLVPALDPVLKFLKTYFAIIRFSLTLLLPHLMNILYNPVYPSGTFVRTIEFL